MRRVILESPYAGQGSWWGARLIDRWRNVRYARRCVRDSLSRGEAPIASHLLYTQAGILNDDNPVERQWGISAGLEWGPAAALTAAYCDRGISKGMDYGMKAADACARPVEIRYLDK